ncbi:MAG: TetR/AcrR family transcriptional regulator [Propionibacteriaceae bacterium]
MAAKGLTRAMLTAAALRIVDSDGLDALSMRRLGSELSVDPMAAYRHIPNKGILLDEVVEAVMSEIDTDAVDASLGWQDQLRMLALSYLATLRAHPHAAPLIAQRSLRTAGALRVVEKALRIMTDAGAELGEAVATIDAIGLLSAGIAQAAIASHEPGGRAAGDPFAGLEPGEFPLLTRAAEAGVLSDGLADVLSFAVDGMIAALEAKMLPAEG